MTRQSHRKERVGVVVSTKMQKTVVVAVESSKRHRIYKKLLRQTRRFKVHDENNACGLGDIVRIVETRPLSREKRWRVAEVVVRGEVAEVAPKEIDAEIIKQITPETPPLPPAPEPAVGEAQAVEEPESAAEEAVPLEEAEPAPEEAVAVEEPETIAEEAVAVEEPETAAEGDEGDEETPRGAAEAEEPSRAAPEEAPEAEEKQ